LFKKIIIIKKSMKKTSKVKRCFIGVCMINSIYKQTKPRNILKKHRHSEKAPRPLTVTETEEFLRERERERERRKLGTREKDRGERKRRHATASREN